MTLLNDPNKIDEEIEKTQRLSEENLLDKSLKDRIRELKMMKTVALKKKLVDAASGKIKLDQPEGASHYKEKISSSNHRSEEKSRNEHPPIHASSAPASVVVARIPENSVYYHPVHNPLGTPPPGQPELYISKPPATAPRPPVPAQPAQQLVIGGQNGIPLPPPRPSPQSLFQGQYIAPQSSLSAPPPPPPPRLSYMNPSNIAFGGTGGIPPPPPLPNPSYLGNPIGIQDPSSYLNQQGQPCEVSGNNNNKRRREPAGPSFDPLDPSATGYVEQFGRHKKAAVGAINAEEPTPSPVNAAPILRPPLPPTVETVPPNNNINTAKDTAATVAYGIYQSSSGAPFRHGDDHHLTGQDIVDTAPVPAPPPLPFGGFKVLSAEELMRRRQATIASDAAIAPAGPSLPSQPDSQDYEYGVAKQVEENENEVAEPSRPSVLAGLADYGSDDDEDDLDTGTVEKEQISSGNSVFSMEQRGSSFALPAPGPAPALGPKLPTSKSFSDEDQKYYVSQLSASYYPPPPGPSAPSSSLVGSAPSGETSLVAPPPTLIRGPKIVKTDKAVTAFVPSVLKSKKQVSSTKPLSSSSSSSSSISPSQAPSSAQAPANHSTAVDDAYKLFLEELNVLGAI